MREEKIWTRGFIFLMLSLFLIASANYYFASSVAIYAKLITHSGLYAGTVTAAFYLGSVGMRLINGTMVQKYGTRCMMLFSAALCMVACFAHNFANMVGLLIFFRVLHGIAYSIFTTASGTAASFLVPRSRLSEGIGYAALGNVLAMSIGPAVALAIISEVTLDQFHRLFTVAGFICLAALILVYFIKDTRAETWQGKSETMTAPASMPKTFLGFEQGVVLPALINFLMAFGYSPAFVYLSAYGLYKGWKNVGMAYLTYAAGLFISRLFAGRLSDKYGPDCVMLPGLTLGIVALVAMSRAPSVQALYMAMLILGLCVGAFNPQINVFCILRCSRQRRGTATAAFNGSADLGLAAGSAVGGIYITYFGYRFTYLAGAVLCFITLLTYIFTLSHFTGYWKHLLGSEK